MLIVVNFGDELTWHFRWIVSQIYEIFSDIHLGKSLYKIFGNKRHFQKNKKEASATLHGSILTSFEGFKQVLWNLWCQCGDMNVWKVHFGTSNNTELLQKVVLSNKIQKQLK